MPAHPFTESFDLEAAFGDVSEYWSPKVVALWGGAQIGTVCVRREKRKKREKTSG